MNKISCDVCRRDVTNHPITWIMNLVKIINYKNLCVCPECDLSLIAQWNKLIEENKEEE